MWRSRIADVVASGFIIVSICAYSLFSLYISFLPDNKVANLFGRTRADLMATAAAGAALVLLIPALKVSDTVYKTYTNVTKLGRPAVHVLRHNSTNTILRFIKSRHYDSITIFLGFADTNLVNQSTNSIGLFKSLRQRLH